MSWIDLTEPDPKHNGAVMRNERLALIWKDKQGNEMTGLFGRGCLKKRSSEANCPWAQGSSPPASTTRSNATLRESINCGLRGSRACRGARCGLSGLKASSCGSMSLSLAVLQRSMLLSSYAVFTGAAYIDFSDQDCSTYVLTLHILFTLTSFWF